MRSLLALTLWASLTAPLLADPSPAPSGSPAASSHAYDPCAMISQQDVASAAGVAVNQVFVPQKPTENECVWAIGNKAGTPGQQVALTVQTVGQVQQAHGMARFGAILSAEQNIPGVSLPQTPVVQHAFADAQIIVGLGDRAGCEERHALRAQERDAASGQRDRSVDRFRKLDRVQERRQVCADEPQHNVAVKTASLDLP